MQLTITEADAVEKLRAKVGDILSEADLSDDRFLWRWLRARSFNVCLAEKMLRESIKWRQENGIDKILTDYDLFDENNTLTEPIRELMLKFVGAFIIGFDKQGSPLIFLRAGKIDINGILQIVNTQELLMALTYYLEKCMDLMRKTNKFGKTVYSYTCIIDMDGLALLQVANKRVIENVIQALTLVEKNYPETIKKIWVLNAYRVFNAMWKIVKPIMDENTASKIKIYSNNQWKEDILEEIDPSVLPVHYSGTRTDGTGDPTCPTLTGYCGKIPKDVIESTKAKFLEIYEDRKERLKMETENIKKEITFRESNEHEKEDITPSAKVKQNSTSSNENANEEIIRNMDDEQLLTQSNSTEATNNDRNRRQSIKQDTTKPPMSKKVNSIVINRGSAKSLEITVPISGSVLRWSFDTEHFDIMFAAHRKTPEGLEEYLAKRRVSCHTKREVGEIECLKPGTYILEFDNSHSRLRRKKVNYALQIIQPVEPEYIS